MYSLFVSLSDFKTITLGQNQGMSTGLSPLAFVAMVVAIALAVLLLRPRRRHRSEHRRSVRRSASPPAETGPRILIDGSNVMHWEDNKPSLAPVRQVIRQVRAQGYAPGVVFDANAGWKLVNRYMNDAELAFALDLSPAQVLVVPKGQQADPYLLDVAREQKARIITNDRFRDWADRYPEVQGPGFLVRGGWQAGTLSLRGLPDAKAVAAA